MGIMKYLYPPNAPEHSTNMISMWVSDSRTKAVATPVLSSNHFLIFFNIYYFSFYFLLGCTENIKKYIQYWSVYNSPPYTRHPPLINPNFYVFQKSIRIQDALFFALLKKKNFDIFYSQQIEHFEFHVDWYDSSSFIITLHEKIIWPVTKWLAYFCEKFL